MSTESELKALRDSVNTIRVAQQKMQRDITRIGRLLDVVYEAINPVKASSIEFYAFIDGKLTKVDRMNLQQGENAQLVLAIKDAQGNPAKVEGDKVDWSIDGDQGLGSLEVAADFMSALYVPTGAPGSVKIQAKGDADLGAGVAEIMGEVEIVILSGQATVMELSASAVPKV